MLAKNKNSKYYIHLILYLIIIILLSVSLTGPWIDTQANSRYGSISFQFNLFRIKSVAKINILNILLDYFDIVYRTVVSDNYPFYKRTIYSKDNIDTIPNKVKDNLRPIIVKIDEDFNKFNVENIRNESVDKSLRFTLIDTSVNYDNLKLLSKYKKYEEKDIIFLNKNTKTNEEFEIDDEIMSLKSNLNYKSYLDVPIFAGELVKLTDNSTIVADDDKQEAFVQGFVKNPFTLYFDRSLGTVVEQKTDTDTIIKLKIRQTLYPDVSIGTTLKIINMIFNEYRVGDDVYFDSMTNTVDEKAKRVKSGELKKQIKKIQDLVRKYALIIQIILISSIVLLGIHFLLVLFKGRRKGIFRFSGIITVFLPLLIIILFIIIFFIISTLAPEIMTIYYKLYAIATFLLIATFILGLIKII